MRKRFSDIQNCNLSAIDGFVGSVADLLIEEDTWNVRYLVVRLEQDSRRCVLISPAAIERLNVEGGAITTLLSSRQVIDSPLLESTRSVSRQYEDALVQYYGWPIYWLGRAVNLPSQRLGGMAGSRSASSPTAAESKLRSAAEICGYRIVTNNGPAGEMSDLVVHLNSWRVEYATAKFCSWLLPGSSMFSTDRIESVNWSRREISVDRFTSRGAPVHQRPQSTHPRLLGESLSPQPYRTV